MDAKKAKILYQIQNGENLTKSDVKRTTGYSMSTVLKYVDELAKEGLINCGQKKVKSGKIPAELNVNASAYVLGLGCYKGKIYGARSTLNGSVNQFTEIKGSSEKDVINVLEKLKTEEAPVALGFIGELSDESLRSLGKVARCPITRGDIAYGLACFYRFYNVKSNVDIAVVYVDDKLRVLKSGDSLTYYQVESLFSPIMNSKKGRLTYEEVLAENNVKERLETRFSSTFKDMESAFDNDVFLYRERLELATAELVGLADKLIKPAVTVIGGSYLKEDVISKATAYRPFSKLIFAGNVEDAVGAIATSIALSELYCY